MFLPWGGFFYLIKKSDKFIFLTQSKLEKNSWQTKNKILSNKKIVDLILPIKGSRLQKICNATIDENINWRRKISNTLTQSYIKHPFGKKITEILTNVINDKNIVTLKELNISLIKVICNYLDIKFNFEIDSDFTFKGKKSEKLKNICNYFNSKDYMSPSGSRDYIENENILNEAEINVFYLHQDKKLKYDQFKNLLFVDNLSIIDIIANIGPANTNKFLEKKFKLIK